MSGFENYKKWCKAYGLTPGNYKNLYLYTKRYDIDFLTNDLEDYKNELTENQLKAIKGE